MPALSIWRYTSITFRRRNTTKNIAEYGNTSAASIPLVLSELQDLGKIHSGSRVLAVGFGGGLTWGGALIEFA